jgi:hypothetical protein
MIYVSLGSFKEPLAYVYYYYYYYYYHAEIRIFSGYTRTLTKDTALSEDGRGAAWSA